MRRSGVSSAGLATCGSRSRSDARVQASGVKVRNPTMQMNPRRFTVVPSKRSALHEHPRPHGVPDTGSLRGQMVHVRDVPRDDVFLLNVLVVVVAELPARTERPWLVLDVVVQPRAEVVRRERVGRTIVGSWEDPDAVTRRIVAREPDAAGRRVLHVLSLVRVLH